MQVRKTKVVSEFNGEYDWLSNFVPVEIKYAGRTYPSVEHAYQSAKSTDEVWKNTCQDITIHAGAIKRMSKHVKIAKNWDAVKYKIMKKLIHEKFNVSVFKDRLLATGEMYLEEGNRWGDKYWGVDIKTGVGFNHLGNLIVAKRNLLKLTAK